MKFLFLLGIALASFQRAHGVSRDISAFEMDSELFDSSNNDVDNELQSFNELDKVEESYETLPFSVTEFQSNKAQEVDKPSAAFELLMMNQSPLRVESFEDQDQDDDDDNETDSGGFEEDLDFEDVLQAEDAEEEDERNEVETPSSVPRPKSPSTFPPPDDIVAKPATIQKPSQANLRSNLKDTKQIKLSNFATSNNSSITRPTQPFTFTQMSTAGAAIDLSHWVRYAALLIFLGTVSYLTLFSLISNKLISIGETKSVIVYAITIGIGGLLGGGLFVCCFNIASHLFGAVLGLFVGLIFVESSIFASISIPLGARIAIVLAWVVVGIMLGHFIRQPLLIVMTATLGSWLVFVGLDFVVVKSGFHSLLNDLRSRQQILWGTKLYGMIAGFGGVAVIASFIHFQLSAPSDYEPISKKL